MVQQTTLPKLVRGEWVPMTYEEFLTWAPDGVRTEWTDGEGIVYMTASDRHQALVLLLASTLDGFVRLFDLGRVSLVPYPMKFWRDGPHREPDVLFVAKAHLNRWTEKRLNGPADFVYESLSEDTAGEDQGRKLRQYAELGIPEYLMTDSRPRRYTFNFLRLDGAGGYRPVEPDEDGRYHSEVLPGFWLRPEWFQQDPLPDANDLLLTIAPEAYEAWLLAKIRARRQGRGRR
jgi:Uma2 family endonuclease